MPYRVIGLGVYVDDSEDYQDIQDCQDTNIEPEWVTEIFSDDENDSNTTPTAAELAHDGAACYHCREVLTALDCAADVRGLDCLIGRGSAEYCFRMMGQSR